MWRADPDRCTLSLVDERKKGCEGRIFISTGENLNMTVLLWVTPKKDWERGMRILSEGTHWVSWDWEEEEGLRKDDSDPEEEYPIMKIEEGEELRKT